VIKLSEFNVSADRSSGYRAQNAITATGFGSNIIDTPVVINVLTSEFVQDVGGSLQSDVLRYVPGIVTNVTAFGAFVDIGVHQDGLVHVSQLADRFIKDPSEVVKVGQKVQVFVVEVDLERKRIALSMKANPTSAPRENRTSPVAPRPPGGGPRPGGSSVGRPQGGQRPPARGWENAGGLSALADAFDKAKPKP
jgi:transcriptional accessory protein Tex/SPT6